MQERERASFDERQLWVNYWLVQVWDLLGLYFTCAEPGDDVLALGAQFDPANVLDANRAAVACRLEDDFLELLGFRQPAEGSERGLE